MTRSYGNSSREIHSHHNHFSGSNGKYHREIAADGPAKSLCLESDFQRSNL